MYKTILITLDRNPTDRAIIDHIKPLARLLQSRIVLLHVATSVAARYHQQDAGGEEVRAAREYLNQIREEMAQEGIPAETDMAFGDPAVEIVRWVEKKGCDLIAMSTHGHHILADLFLGHTAIKVQHNLSVPVLLLRAK